MSSRNGARARKYHRPLTESGIARILAQILPRRNGYRVPNTEELLREATDFGIASELQFRRILLKHRKALIADDRACSESRLLAFWIEDLGEAQVREMRRRKVCFTWEGMTRNAFELEFGAAYEEYSRKRDGLEPIEPEAKAVDEAPGRVT